MGIKFKWQALYVGLFLGVAFALGDQISVKLFKEVFERLRPCHNDEIAHLVHTIRFSFVSSHATNSFAVAVFTGLTLRKHYRFLLPALLFWAAIVSYSRIYVGVHYPGDLICGSAIGTIIAFFVYFLLKVCNKQFNLKIPLEL